jgi:hypothetical protein
LAIVLYGTVLRIATTKRPLTHPVWTQLPAKSFPPLLEAKEVQDVGPRRNPSLEQGVEALPAVAGAVARVVVE